MVDKELDILKQKIVEVLKNKNIKKAGIFGSFARGENNKKSDVDILIELNKEFSLLDLVNLKLELEKFLRKKVDLVEYKTIKPELKKQILSEEIKII